MSKKHKTRETPKIERVDPKPGPLDRQWEKIALILLFAIPLIYFAQFLSANRMIAGNDYLIGGYPFEEWTAGQKETPLWYPQVFGGIPVLGQPVGGPFAPLAQLRLFLPPQVVLALTFIIVFFLAGLGTYLYLKDIGLSQYSAALGAFVFQFAGNLATTPFAGHAGRAASVALFPLMLFFTHRSLKTRQPAYFLLLSLVTAFAFFDGHFQITYYALLFILAYVVYYLISRRRELTRTDYLKICGYGFAAVLLIFLLMAMIWLPVLAGLKTAARGQARGFEYAASWAMPPAELIDLFVPSYSGLLEGYWGANPFKQHTEYFGLLTICLAVFAVIAAWKKSPVKFFLFAAAAVVLAALGGATPFFRLLYTVIPGFKLTRAPALVFYLASFSFVVLASIGFESAVVKRGMERKKFLTAAGLTLALFILMVLAGAAIGPNLSGDKAGLYENNSSAFTQGILLGLGLLALGLGTVYLAYRRKINTATAALIAIGLSLVSLIPLMTKFLPKGPAPEKYYAADDVVKFLKNDQSVFRVFPLYYPHAGDSYLLYHDIQSAGGYIPNPIQRYMDYIGVPSSVMFNPHSLVQSPRLTDMLNLKYVIAPNLPEDKDLSRYEPGDQELIRYVKNFLRRFKPVFQGARYAVFQNDSVLPRAYIVADYQVADAKDVLGIMQSPAFDPRSTVILEKDPNLPRAPGKLPMAEARITDYRANRVVCQTDDPVSGFLVLADNWHPDWRVSIDGRPAELYRADYIFRAVYLPSGKHEVVFSYISSSFINGKYLSLVSFILVLILLITSLWSRFIKKPHPANDPPAS